MKYAGATGNEPGRPRPESIDQALARLTADQQGLPVDAGPRRGWRRERSRVVGRARRSLTSQPWFLPVVRWVVIVGVLLLLARCIAS